MADVFISFAKDNLSLANKLKTIIENENLETWFYPEQSPGEMYRPKLKYELDNCKCVVVLWSEAAIHSQFVTDEADHAKRANKYVPARLDGVEIPLGFRQVTYADLNGWKDDDKDDEVRKLISSIWDTVNRNEDEAQTESSQRIRIKFGDPIDISNDVGEFSIGVHVGTTRISAAKIQIVSQSILKY